MLVKHSQRTLKTPCRCHGSKDLYWAHDTDNLKDRNGFALRACSACGVTGRFVLINADSHTRTVKQGEPVSSLDRHSWNGDAPTDLPEPTAVDDTESEPEMPVTVIHDDTKVDALTALVAQLAAKVDALTPKREIPALSHKALADVMLDLDAGENVLMVGPAGTGKSSIAKGAAKALGMDYYEISLNPGLTRYRVGF